MKTDDKLEALFEQITALPDAAQNELIHALAEMRAEHLGLCPLDDDEREGSYRSAEDISLKHIALDEQIDQMHIRYNG